MKPTFRTSVATLALCVATGAQASTYIVTKTTDSMDGLCDSDCSLREAVQAANLHPGSDTIRLASGRYVLTIAGVDEDENLTGDLDIKGQLNIVGDGIAATIIDGKKTDRVFDVPAGSFLKIYLLTITGGATLQAGGGIRNAGTAMLRSTRITNNFAELDNDVSTYPTDGSPACPAGGGIFNSGTLTLESCTVDSNDVANTNEGFGGAGGGINNRGTLYLRRSVIQSNGAGFGRSLAFGGGIFNSGQAFIEQTSLVGNQIGKFGTGTAIDNRGSLELSNSTVSGNAMGSRTHLEELEIGGAVSNRGAARLSFVTITNNTGGGLLNRGTASLSGALIAGNLSVYITISHDDPFPFDPKYPIPPSPYAGFNCETSNNYTSRNTLIGRDGRCPGQINVDNGTVFTTLLEPLRLGGGVTATHKLLRGSVAVDAINPFAEVGADACPATDQRGARRPPSDDGRRGGYCDIGAYELRQ